MMNMHDPAASTCPDNSHCDERRRWSNWHTDHSDYLEVFKSWKHTEKSILKHLSNLWENTLVPSVTLTKTPPFALSPSQLSSCQWQSCNPFQHGGGTYLLFRLNLQSWPRSQIISQCWTALTTWGSFSNSVYSHSIYNKKPFTFQSSRGLMDKASDFGSGDCGFESHRGRDDFLATCFLFFCKIFLPLQLDYHVLCTSDPYSFGSCTLIKRAWEIAEKSVEVNSSNHGQTTLALLLHTLLLSSCPQAARERSSASFPTGWLPVMGPGGETTR